ncbi:MAG TPA: DUF72 domain-containing protein [Nitrososphaerales archaeon]|nr:DUF72 domain-containing protein [Nitrososphaerales archaeon]HUK74394.1 DUF72 domain-containing protein [Nitrososphaerales archaeon]
MGAKARVGVSGFSYPAWKGRFYPDDTKSEDFLPYYAQRLNTVEINSSFYAAPSAAMVKSWASRTEEGFRFAFKAPKQVTHILKLGKGAAEAAARLSKTLEGLGTRRGPVLYQLAPFTKQDLGLLESFLADTAGQGGRVFEFRHASWLQEPTYRLLDKNEAGFCIAETEDMEPVFRVTGGLAYFRLRKDSYDSKAIDAWAKKVRQVAEGSRERYVYLRHDETGENAVLAQRLLKALGEG